MKNPPSIAEAHPPLPLKELVDAVRSFSEMRRVEQKSLLKDLVQRHPILCLRWGPGWRFRRARRLEPDVIPINVAELIWRSDIPAKLGRANPRGFPVVYLSDRVDTALREVGADDDHTVLAEFCIRAGKAAVVAPLGEMSLIQRTGRGILSGDASSAVTEMLNACEREAGKSLLITDSFLRDVLLNVANDYDLSSTIAMAIFEKLSNVDVIAFPSARQMGAVNWAVRTAGFWDSWGVVSVRRGQATYLAQGIYDFRTVAHVDGIMINGNLQWSPRPKEEPECVWQLDPPWHPQKLSQA